MSKNLAIFLKECSNHLVNMETTVEILEEIEKVVGNKYLLLGTEMAPFSADWTRKYISRPKAVVKPLSTFEVSEVVKICNKNDIRIVPVSGNTGLAGGTSADDSIIISLERLNKVTNINKDAKIATVESGVILSNLHELLKTKGLIFPLTFGAKGSAMIGGVLSTNAGGSNVLRYGNTRALCMGIEVVLPDGRIMNLMNELHKDNTGYDLKNLIIGAEGTLGIITAAVLKLSPEPISHATAMIATPSLDNALNVLNKLQEATGGCVDAFEYMPKEYIETHLKKVSSARLPFNKLYKVNIMLEVSTTIPEKGLQTANGETPLVLELEKTLSELMVTDDILDAIIAKSEAERNEMWERREASAEITITGEPLIIADISVPLDKVTKFIEKMDKAIETLDPGARSLTVAHLGDGNIHYAIYPTREDPSLFDVLNNSIEDIIQSLGGSFSAEHGVGISKKKSMARLKDPIALEVMKAIKNTFDPKNLMNPGKVLPDS